MNDVFKKENAEIYSIDIKAIKRLIAESRILHEIKDVLDKKDVIMSEIYGVPVIEGYYDIVALIENKISQLDCIEGKTV